MSRRSTGSGIETGTSRIDMRNAVRHPILQRCFVRPARAPVPQPWQCIAYNISATGLGLTLPVQLPEGTVLTIEAWKLPRACPLQVRIVQTRLVELFWFTGCDRTTSTT